MPPPRSSTSPASCCLAPLFPPSLPPAMKRMARRCHGRARSPPGTCHTHRGEGLLGSFHRRLADDPAAGQEECFRASRNPPRASRQGASWALSVAASPTPTCKVRSPGIKMNWISTSKLMMNHCLVFIVEYIYRLGNDSTILFWTWPWYLGFTGSQFSVRLCQAWSRLCYKMA